MGEFMSSIVTFAMVVGRVLSISWQRSLSLWWSAIISSLSPVMVISLLSPQQKIDAWL